MKKSTRYTATENGFAVTLIKPQFECENKNIGKSGIVHPSAHADIVDKVFGYAKDCGLSLYGITNAPISKPNNDSRKYIKSL